MPRRAGIAAAALMLALPSTSLAQVRLELGFYVDVTAGCANASNATLGLLHRTGINSARTQCNFKSLVPIAANRYQFQESCTEIGRNETYEDSGVIELLSETSFRLSGEGYEVTMTYCPQDALPDPWSATDISGIIGPR